MTETSGPRVSGIAFSVLFDFVSDFVFRISNLPQSISHGCFRPRWGGGTSCQSTTTLLIPSAKARPTPQATIQPSPTPDSRPSSPNPSCELQLLSNLQEPRATGAAQPWPRTSEAMIAKSASLRLMSELRARGECALNS
jgi:hypothetical protein